ncbi:MAG: sigma 54-interacting transcriptional regulator [Gemmatimonadales bacterium]|nr:sigma 54-interacting transcriptional regulator [Gemmatimonadales bacterium]
MAERVANQLDLESIKDLLLELAREQDLSLLLECLVRRLAKLDTVALARVWLIRPGDICAECHLARECPSKVRCLHLVASAGRSKTDPLADWTRLNGRFRRFPLGVRKVGRIATGETLALEDVQSDTKWIVDPDWARREGIRGFGGHPLEHHGEILGVLAVFSRAPWAQDHVDWLRLVADHAAAAIANANAFDEIQLLRQQLELENAYLREAIDEARAFGDLIGTSPALRAIEEQIELVAPTDATVLILGESGVGKSLVAREIHGGSSRKDRPLITVNCASIPRELYESEFFGHAKGAFTGAVKDRAGRFEAADGGTLFLDEVGEIPLQVQGKLLRVLQEGEYERVGEDRTRTVNVRILAATNHDLMADVKEGRFREDLYYRLNVFPITVPPLRERPEDLTILAQHFLEAAAARFGREGLGLRKSDLELLKRYDWPGNVRELQNVIERAVITARGRVVRFDRSAFAAGTVDSVSQPVDAIAGEVLSPEQLRDQERRNTLAALTQTNWKVYGPGGAAELLGVKPTPLAYRMKKLGVRRPG